MKLNVMMATTVLLPLVLLLAVASSVAASNRCPRISSSPSPYDCWNNYDHNELTLRKIDCNRQYSAASLYGCLALCTPAPRCYGVVFIPDQYGWLAGKYCCIFKKWGMKCRWIKRQHNRITCRWVGTGGDSAGAEEGNKSRK